MPCGNEAMGMTEHPAAASCALRLPSTDEEVSKMEQRHSARRSGQSVLEYVVLIAAAVLVIVVGQIYFKRALQGRWKETADQVGEQFTTAREYTIETQQVSARKEETGTPAQVTGTTGSTGTAGTDPNWTQSTVMGTNPIGTDLAGVGGVITTYPKHEVTKTDYVTPATTGRAVGTHTTFDSGQLSKTKLFDDD